MRKKDILPFATTWVDLEDIMLSDISQREKDKYCMIPHMWKLKQKPQLINQWNGGYQELRAGRWGGEWGRCCYRIHAYSLQINKSHRSNTQFSDYKQNGFINIKLAKELGLNCLN